MTRALIITSFLIGAIPVTVLLIMYAARTPWRAKDNPAGKAMLGLFAATEAGYILSLVTLSFPAWGTSPTGEWVRIVARALIGLVFWILLRVFMRAQKAGAAHDAALAGLEAARSYIQDQPGGEFPPASVLDDPQET